MKTPPDRVTLESLLLRAGMKPRELLRAKENTYTELGLADEALSDARLLDALLAHPILINRPIVVSALGVKLCRPAETVRELLPA